MIDTTKFKARLTEELQELEEELKSVGRKNPLNPADWEATAPEAEDIEADTNEAADRIEGYEENSAILKELETRYNEVKEALARIEAGTYGILKISQEPIEEKRLEADPAADTCTKHMN
jgi:RNA polymerase-binding transcription factor DksA